MPEEFAVGKCVRKCYIDRFDGGDTIVLHGRVHAYARAYMYSIHTVWFYFRTFPLPTFPAGIHVCPLSAAYPTHTHTVT